MAKVNKRRKKTNQKSLSPNHTSKNLGNMAQDYLGPKLFSADLGISCKSNVKKKHISLKLRLFFWFFGPRDQCCIVDKGFVEF